MQNPRKARQLASMRCCPPNLEQMSLEQMSFEQMNLARPLPAHLKKSK
jgi:hypothetical protein